MDEKYELFKKLLEEENKEKAVSYALKLIQKKEMDVLELYTRILAPALNAMECRFEDKNICVWKEHVRTAIVRTIVECCYPYVIEKKQEMNYPAKGIAAVLCPPEEYHDLGARMTADFFLLCGYQVVYVGSNTPYQDFYNVINIIKPEIIAISVSNYYNLVSTKKIIQELKHGTFHSFKIVVGGYAFDKDINNVNTVGADYYAHTFEDIDQISRNEVQK